jgi:hypothetical protein
MKNTGKALPMGSFGNKTTFTAVVYYSHRMDGSEYSYAEKQAYKNRYFHPSFDYKLTEKGATVTTHNEAYTKIMGMLERKRNTIITALVEYNAPDGTTYRIAKITRTSIQIYAKPVWGIGKNMHDVIVRKLEGNPIKMERREVA